MILNAHEKLHLGMGHYEEMLLISTWEIREIFLFSSMLLNNGYCSCPICHLITFKICFVYWKQLDLDKIKRQKIFLWKQNFPLKNNRFFGIKIAIKYILCNKNLKNIFLVGIFNFTVIFTFYLTNLGYVYSSIGDYGIMWTLPKGFMSRFIISGLFRISFIMDIYYMNQHLRLLIYSVGHYEDKLMNVHVHEGLRNVIKFRIYNMNRHLNRRNKIRLYCKLLSPLMFPFWMNINGI